MLLPDLDIGISLGSIAGTFKILRKVMVIAVSVGDRRIRSLLRASVPYCCRCISPGCIPIPPIEGYSHSLLAVAAGYFISKAVFMQFHIPDCSIALSVGMLGMKKVLFGLALFNSDDVLHNRCFCRTSPTPTKLPEKLRR